MHTDQHQSLYKLRLLFLMQVARYLKSTKNRELVTFLQNVKKECRSCFCVLLWFKTFSYFMVILSCLLLLVSLHSQNVEIVCLTLQYSNYVGRICHLCWLCSKLMFFKRSTVYCSKSTYAHQTSQKKLASDLVIQIIPPKVLQECTTILQLKVFIVYVVQKLVGHPP